jgi:hypothetical protein
LGKSATIDASRIATFFNSGIHLGIHGSNDPLRGITMRTKFWGTAIAPVLFATCLGLTGLASSARGDGMIMQLPEDGAWVEYNVRMVANNSINITGKARIASVGKAFTEQGACRWIEAKVEVEVNGGTVKGVAKFLVPEAELKRGSDPSAHIVKSWGKLLDAPLADLKVEPSEPVTQIVQIFAGKPLQEAKDLPTINIANKLGNLECPGASGVTEFVGLQGKTMKPKIETRWNEKVPFGVVEHRMDLDEALLGDARLTVQIHLTYEDSGKEAVSELQDAQ